jgi:hypothetical protein
MSHLREVFDRFRCAGLTVKPDKEKFTTEEISFLGHLVSPAGIRVDPDRTQAIKIFLPPKDVKAVTRFIGMVNFYHKFIPCLADVAAPLNMLSKKGVKFLWAKNSRGLLNR